MHSYVFPALFSLFVWWFSTGAIIFLDNLPAKTFIYSVIGASAVLAGCLLGLHVTAAQTTVTAAYEAFFFGLFAWGWQEITFYMGYVTGNRNEPCPEGCSGWAHFVHAVQTSLYHELAIIGSAIAIVALTWHQPNQIGMWTFMVLWWMHQSAKLNVFFGVRNLNEEFLPEHLTFLKSFLKSKPMNLFFPISITISMVVTTLLWVHAIDATSAFQRSGDHLPRHHDGAGNPGALVSGYPAAGRQTMAMGPRLPQAEQSLRSGDRSRLSGRRQDHLYAPPPGRIRRHGSAGFR